jgi:hypothetical protein
MKSILRWIDFNTDPYSLTFIVGDFNALPFGETYKMIIDYGYLSSHFHLHKDEPVKTFHNKMQAPCKDDADEGTFDYIL